MSQDVVVIGGGAIGACAALELANRGVGVTLLERGPELAWGCSAGNAGLICPSRGWPLATPSALKLGLRWMWKRDSPLYLRPRPAVIPWLARFMLSCTTEQATAGMTLIRELSIASLLLHLEYVESGLHRGLERRGTLNAYTSESALSAATEAAKENAEAGLRFQALTREQARELEPSLTTRVAGGVLYEDEAHCDPYLFVQAIGDAAAKAGADIRRNIEVFALRRRNGAVEISTSAGGVVAETVVLAAGAWTPGLARQLGLFVPIEGGKGYHIDLAAAPNDPKLPVMLNETRVIATPLPGRLRLAGTLELAGLDLSVDRIRVEAIRRSVAQAVSGLEQRQVVDVWRGLRPCTPDGVPIIGRPDGRKDVVIATGHAMLGLALAPVTGRLLGEIVAGETTSHDLEPLSPDRFRPMRDAWKRRKGRERPSLPLA